MGKHEQRTGAGSVIVSVPLGLLAALMVIGVTAQGRETGSGTVEVGDVVLIQGVLGGGAVLLFLLGAVMGWRELGGRSSVVPAYAFPSAGVALTGLWLFGFAAAYGS